MNTPRRCFALASLTVALAACSQPAAPQDSGRPDTASAQDTGTSQPDAASDAEATDAPSPMDVSAMRDGTTDATSPPADSASDSSSSRDTAAPACLLPLGGTCPAGTTCPAGDGCNRCSCPESGGAPLCTRIACPSDSGVPSDAASGACRTAADCRLFESYCSTDPCSCIPLGADEPDPRCDARTVTCFIPPCRGQSVDCVAGRCVLGSSM